MDKVATSTETRRGACVALRWLLALGLAAASLSATAQPVGAKAPAGAADGVAVTIWQQEIVVLRATIDSATPETRAARAARRIESIPGEEKSYEIKIQPITLGTASGLALSHKGKLLFGIAQGDLDPQEGLTLEQAASRAAKNIEHWLALREEQQSPQLFVRHLLFVLGSSALFVLVLFGVVRLADYWQERRSAAAADRTRRIVLAGIDFRPYLITLEVGVVRLAAWAVYLGLTYVWLTFALNEFPYTRGWGRSWRAFCRTCSAASARRS